MENRRRSRQPAPYSQSVITTYQHGTDSVGISRSDPCNTNVPLDSLKIENKYVFPKTVTRKEQSWDTYLLDRDVLKLLKNCYPDAGSTWAVDNPDAADQFFTHGRSDLPFEAKNYGYMTSDVGSTQGPKCSDDERFDPACIESFRSP